MKITITPTDELICKDGVAARVWQGTTARGAACLVLVHSISLPVSAHCKEFQDAKLIELTGPPPMAIAWR